LELSVVIPVYRAADCVAELHRRLTATLGGMGIPYEIILVDDGSPDASGDIIAELARHDARVVTLLLSRNFGQHAAVTAGLTEARGNWIVVMDCDLQDPPEAIPGLYHKALQGYDVVLGRRIGRKDSFFKRLTSRLWFAIFNRLADLDADPASGNFSIVSRQVIAELLRINDVHRQYLMLLRWLGFRRAYIVYEHGARFAGSSSYSISRLLRHSMATIAAHSTKLLYLAIYLGFLFVLISLGLAGYVIAMKLLYRIGVQGWTSLMAAVWLVGGAVLFSLGVLGIYIGKIFEQVKQRPLFIVRERIGGGT
jgi:glycosyltransferase involved in cell wall biosynthesis